MKERPILIAVIGYMIGILWGLYFNFSVALFYIFIAAIYFILKTFLSKNKWNILSPRRYIRYIKVFFNRKSIYLIIIISIISNLIVDFQNRGYENVYNLYNGFQNYWGFVSFMVKFFYTDYKMEVVWNRRI